MESSTPVTSSVDTFTLRKGTTSWVTASSWPSCGCSRSSATWLKGQMCHFWSGPATKTTFIFGWQSVSTPGRLGGPCSWASLPSPWPTAWGPRMVNPHQLSTVFYTVSLDTPQLSSCFVSCLSASPVDYSSPASRVDYSSPASPVNYSSPASPEDYGSPASPCGLQFSCDSSGLLFGLPSPFGIVVNPRKGEGLRLHTYFFPNLEYLKLSYCGFFHQTVSLLICCFIFFYFSFLKM